jgi:uncharacterized membrane protein
LFRDCFTRSRASAASLESRAPETDAILSRAVVIVEAGPRGSTANEARAGVSMHDWLVVVAAFLASSVEMVEALTIVLAVGMTRGWRSTSYGVAVALATLAVVVAGLGPALTQVPIDTLRVVVGTILLAFGLQWLRKAILRAAGLKALHDEDAIFRHEVRDARAASPSSRHDWYAFTVAFKGVFLEGLEVAFIVVSVGSSQGNIGLAAFGALAALVVVAVVGSLVHAPLSRVPENTLKFGVGIMLTSFGVFWSGEGAGVTWPGGEAALVGVLVFVATLALALTRMLRAAARRDVGTTRTET